MTVERIDTRILALRGLADDYGYDEYDLCDEGYDLDEEYIEEVVGDFLADLDEDLNDAEADEAFAKYLEEFLIDQVDFSDPTVWQV